MPAHLPQLGELLETAHVVSIPTRTRFRGVTEREAVIFEAPNGASEFSPFIEYGSDEASSWLAAAIEFGWAELPPTHRDTIAVNATVPAVTATEVPHILARFAGCTTAKIKVAEPGQSLSDDVDRVRAVREALGPQGVVRIDANGGWSVDEAYVALAALTEFDLDYAEQPCMSVGELAELRTRLGQQTTTPVRIAADESVRKASDPLAVSRAGAADLLIVKAQPLGGIRPAIDIVSEAGLPVVVSSALDTSVGIAMGLHLAASLPEGILAGACGLGTVALLSADVTDDSLLPVNGEIAVTRPALSAELIERHRATPERVAWWRERMTQCYAALTHRIFEREQAGRGPS